MSHSILDKIIASKEDQEKQDFNPTDVVQQLLQLVSTKEADVVRRRFGLRETPKETLEAIGASYDVTRERIRQIQSGAIRKMKKSVEFPDMIRPVEHILSTVLEHYGGVMSQEHLLDEVFISGRSDSQERAAVFLLKELLGHRFVHIKRNAHMKPAWAFRSVNLEFVEKSLKCIVATVREIGMPVDFETLIQAVQQQSFYQQNQHALSEDVLFGYVQLSKKVAENPFGEYGLQKWGSISPKRMNDKIYLVLKKIGKPMHFVDIAKEITAVFTKEAYPPTVHNELILNKQYVLVGRGIYALKEWGYKRGVVADVIETVLEEAGKPLLREDIVERVADQRIVKRNTIHLALTNQERFIRYSDGTYGLADNSAHNN